MEAYKREFIEFLQGAGVLKFGDFTAKSGRKIPYFVIYGKGKRKCEKTEKEKRRWSSRRYAPELRGDPRFFWALLQDFFARC